MPLDLTSFGFTPTETAVYRRLTELGPLGGYAVAKALSIARANAYQALHGLVAKGAATRLEGRPERFRPVQPLALFSAIAQRMASQLDALEADLARQPPAGASATIPITGLRALSDIALRTAARSPGPARCIAPARELTTLAPAWHKRAAANWPTELWCLGELPDRTEIPSVAGCLETAAARGYFGGLILALSAGGAAVLAHLAGTTASGFWTSDPVQAGAVHATIDRLTSVEATHMR